MTLFRPLLLGLAAVAAFPYPTLGDDSPQTDANRTVVAQNEPSEITRKILESLSDENENDAPKPVRSSTAELNALDRVTARVSKLKISTVEPIVFERLEITMRACYLNPPEERPESRAYLEVVETRPDDSRVEVFGGWMFASAPAVNSMQHPVYDVRLIRCLPPADGD